MVTLYGHLRGTSLGISRSRNWAPCKGGACNLSHLISFVRDGSGIPRHGQLSKAFSVVLRPYAVGKSLLSTLPSIPYFWCLLWPVCAQSVFSLCASNQATNFLPCKIHFESIPRGQWPLLPLATTMATYYQQIVSSDRLPNARRPEFTPLEQQQKSLEKVQRYLDTPVEEDVLVNDNTKAHHQWLMRI